MSRAYTYKSLASEASVGASETALPISQDFTLSPEDSTRIWAAVKASSVSVSAGISFSLQTSFDGGSTWVTPAKAATAITTDGTFVFSLDIEIAADQASFPLGPKGRVICTTGAGDSLDLDSVNISARR